MLYSFIWCVHFIVVVVTEAGTSTSATAVTEAEGEDKDEDKEQLHPAVQYAGESKNMDNNGQWTWGVSVQAFRPYHPSLSVARMTQYHPAHLLASGQGPCPNATTH